MHRLALTLVLLLAFSAYADTVFFAGRIGQAEIPKGYDHFFEERGKTLVLLPQGEKRVEIRFTFNSLREYLRQRPSIGKDLVQDTAKKKGKEIFPVKGNGAVAFVDFSEARVTSAGQRIQSTHGMMGLTDSYVTFTVTTTEENASSEFVKRLLSDGIKELLGYIKSGT